MEQKTIKVAVLVDPQIDFANANGALPAEGAEAAVQGCVSFVHNDWDEILVTLDAHDQNTYATTQEGKRLPVPHCIKNTAGEKIVPAILRALQDVGNAVPYPKNAFGSSSLFNDLVEMYGDKKNVEIHFAGFVTDICVLTNVVLAKTACPEARIVLHEYACAGTSKEAHARAVAVMMGLQVDVIKTEQETLYVSPQRI